MRYQVVTTAVGAVTIRHMDLEETIHPSGPALESIETYVKQSKLRDKLLSEDSKPLVIFDVGLGGAANTSAAVDCWKDLRLQGGKPRNLEIYSFENDLSVLGFTLENIQKFHHLNSNLEILETLVNEKIYEMPGLRWEILEGEFEDRMSSLARKVLPHAEVIFHDPYSPLKNPNMWDLKTFNNLRDQSTDNCVLVTFSQATRVRAALIAAGFYVGHGTGLGMKRESTVASTAIGLLEVPLETTWINKWANSDSAFPHDVDLKMRDEFEAKLRSQFMKWVRPGNL